MHFRKFSLLMVGLSVLAAPLAVHAEAADLLPDDTSVVVTVNLRQLLDSALFKKYGADKFKDFLDKEEQAKALKEVGFDPLKHLSSVTFSMAGKPGDNKGLLIMTGEFDREKLAAKAIEYSKAKPSELKIHALGKSTVYEVKNDKMPEPAFVTIADEKTLLMAPSKEDIIAGLEKATGAKKSNLKNKEIAALLAKVDAKQTIWVVAPSSAFPKEIPIDNEKVKGALQALDAIILGITITDAVKLDIRLSAKDDEGAKSLNTAIREGLKQAQGAILLLGGEQLAPLAEVIAGVKPAVTGKDVGVGFSLSAEIIEKLSKLAP